ncbi:hypothetical protein AGMMS49592_2810 [Endomicrobiia bacterium]|nr:hypothetical protein AGMMS49592_2810 [Endomicrobiia bacterium]
METEAAGVVGVAGTRTAGAATVGVEGTGKGVGTAGTAVAGAATIHAVRQQGVAGTAGASESGGNSRSRRMR